MRRPGRRGHCVGSVRHARERGDPRKFATSGLVFYGRSDLGLSYGGVLLASGTSPPVVTITGTQSAAIGLHIEIDSTAGGTGLGQATFKWSVDNGTTYPAGQTGVLTGATITLGRTGLTAVFPPGPYNTDNKYDVTAATWADQSSGAHHPTQATASKQAKLIASSTPNGRPALRYDGVDDLHQIAFTLSEPTTMFLTAKANAIDGTNRAYYDGVNVQSMWILHKTGVYAIVDINGSGLFGTSFAAGAYHVLTNIYNHTTSVLRQDGVQTGAGSLGGVIASVDGLTLGSTANSGALINCDIAEVALFNTVVNASAIGRIEKHMKAFNGLA